MDKDDGQWTGTRAKGQGQVPMDMDHGQGTRTMERGQRERRMDIEKGWNMGHITNYLLVVREISN